MLSEIKDHLSAIAIPVPAFASVVFTALQVEEWLKVLTMFVGLASTSAMFMSWHYKAKASQAADRLAEMTLAEAVEVAKLKRLEADKLAALKVTAADNIATLKVVAADKVAALKVEAAAEVAADVVVVVKPGYAPETIRVPSF